MKHLPIGSMMQTAGWLLLPMADIRRGKIIELKSVVNKAMELSPTMEICITVKRTGQEVYMENDRDYWYHDLKALPIAGYKCETEQMDSDDMLFLLYTSGSTGKPKALVHTHGGYSVYTSTTHRMVFDIKPEDRYWCAADPGWITGIVILFMVL